MDEPIYDVVVIGGGAAGLSAALVLARARRRVAAIDAGAPRNARECGSSVVRDRAESGESRMLCGGSGRSVGLCMDGALADTSIEGRRSRQAVDRILKRFQPVRADDLIPLLQQIQEEYGHLPADVLHHVSECTGIPTSRMYGVITFYSLFHLEKRGRHSVRACRGTACHVRGGKGVIQAAQNYLGLADGETGENLMFSFETAACLGACALSPVVVADGVYSGKVTPERVEQILRSIEAAESAG